jgi:hypothetical protein
VSNVQQIEAAMQKLTAQELREIHDWLENFIEDQLELTDQAASAIAEAERELAAGIVSRTRQH